MIASQTPTASLPTYIDSTMMSTFRQCPRKFFTEFCLNLRPARLSIDLHAGGCFASAIENLYHHYYREKLDFDTSMKRTFGQFMDQWGDFVANKETPKSRENVWKAVERYFDQWRPETDPIQPFHKDNGGSFEFTFAIPLRSEALGEPGASDDFPLHPSGAPFIFAGRFDLLGLWQGRPIIRDEKTTTSIGAKWADQWRLRSQFMGYVWACQQSGIPVDTVCVRGIGILKTDIKLAEAFKTFGPSRIARWKEQFRRDLGRLRRAWDEGYFDYNFADACTAYGGCPFLDLCESDHPERWYSQYEQRNWNPINRNPIEGASPPPEGRAA
jgi:hypothetical protein